MHNQKMVARTEHRGCNTDEGEQMLMKDLISSIYSGQEALGFEKTQEVCYFWIMVLY